MKAAHYHRPSDKMSAKTLKAMGVKPQTKWALPVPEGAAPPRTMVQPRMDRLTADLRWPDPVRGGSKENPKE